jgi:hypothetical protein
VYVAKSNATFVFNPMKLDQAFAQLACNDLGGHLAAYTSLEEQAEVENFYVSNGLLFPSYTPNYWFGAKTTFDLWPTFYWLQRSIPGPDTRNYMHWAIGRDPEPNNLAKNEYCAACNFTSSYQGAWGWSDASCSLPMPYMCRLMDTGALGTLSYQSLKTNTTYTINVSPMTQAEAADFCASQGGHPVYYTSLAEQQEVEAWFTKQGVLIPSYHQLYWLGLTTYNWPNFQTLDKSLPQPSRLSYTHWAESEPKDGQQCAGAHVNLAYGNAWGWMDADCSSKGVALCRALSEFRMAPGPPPG